MMSWLRLAVFELLGLFVDDWRFAGSIALWLALMGLVVARLGLPHGVPPVVMFAGLAAVLITSAASKSRK